MLLEIHTWGWHVSHNTCLPGCSREREPVPRRGGETRKFRSCTQGVYSTVPFNSSILLFHSTVPLNWHKLKGTTTEAEEKRQDQTLVEERRFHHAFVSTRAGSFLSKLVVDCSSYTWSPGDGWAWPRWPEHPSFRVSSEGGRERGSDTRLGAYAVVPTPPPTACARELLLFSCWVMFDSLRPHGLQHARLPSPSLSSRVCSNSCPLSRWCHPTITSSVPPFSSHLQSFPTSGSFPLSQLFASGGQSIGASSSASSSNEYSGLISFRMGWGVNGH